MIEGLDDYHDFFNAVRLNCIASLNPLIMGKTMTIKNNDQPLSTQYHH